MAASGLLVSSVSIPGTRKGAHHGTGQELIGGMTSKLDRLPARAGERLRPGPQPEWTAPMLAVLSNRRFSDPGWIFERKLDGERCLAFRRGGSLRLLSRTRQPLNDTYPEDRKSVG